MTALHKWLAHRIELSATWGELLAVVLAAVIVGLIWPSLPSWVFFAGGFTAGMAQGFAGDIRRRIRRRSNA